MKTRILALLLAAAALAAAAPSDARAQQGRAPAGTLTAFGSDAELARFVREMDEKRERRMQEERLRREAEARRRAAAPQPQPQPPAPPSPLAAPPTPCPAVASPAPPEGGAVLLGCVRGAAGEPIAGATVTVEGTSVRAVTGPDGRYQLVVPAASLAVKDVTVSATMLGREAGRRQVSLVTGGAAVLDFVLAATAINLEGLVASAVGVTESITNTQHEGVDEGGIVKVHGDHLVMLRRGRLFTVDVGGRRLRPVSAANAYGDGIEDEQDPYDTWYDELLVSGDQVVVIGYSYQRGGTEIGLFRIGADGRLTHRATYHLRSDDYYSSRNYASRLLDGKLILYAPVPLDADPDEVTAALPALRRWRKGAEDDEFRPVVSATRIYRPGRPLDPFADLTLHTVTTCDLAREEMACEATAVLGTEGRVFYVSPTSVYVWVNDFGRGDGVVRAPSTLYRMPLDGSAPSALGVNGSPVDQFSFLESGDGHLNVVVRSDGSGDKMWGPERARGGVALLRVALERFGDGRRSAPASAYRALPGAENGYAFHNRFVGRHLLYGAGSGWRRPARDAGKGAMLYAVPFAGGATARLALPHGVDRIEAMGGDAVIVGTDGRNVHFTGIDLGAQPRVAQRYLRRDAAQGEMRSHGFFYKPDGPESGTIGLPIRGPAAPGWRHLIDESASVLFLRNAGERFRALGELEALPGAGANDGCVVSCVDWYGNSRPIFLRGRIFALLGYEIVEGALRGGRIRELRRVSYAPSPRTAAR